MFVNALEWFEMPEGFLTVFIIFLGLLALLFVCALCLLAISVYEGEGENDD